MGQFSNAKKLLKDINAIQSPQDLLETFADMEQDMALYEPAFRKYGQNWRFCSEMPVLEQDTIQLNRSKPNQKTDEHYRKDASKRISNLSGIHAS